MLPEEKDVSEVVPEQEEVVDTEQETTPAQEAQEGTPALRPGTVHRLDPAQPGLHRTAGRGIPSRPRLPAGR